MNNNPTITPQVVPSPFHNFCMSIGAIPTSYKDTLDYYETLLWLIKFLDTQVLPALNTNGEAVAELQGLYIQLKDYVEHYFENLDVQEEINNKLDDMVEQGTLQEIIADYLNSKAVFGFDNVASMKEATNLIDGSYAETLGYYAKNDGGNALYKISETKEETDYYETLENGLYAILITNNNYISVKSFGAKGDGTTDDTTSIQNAIDYGFYKKLKVLVPSTANYYKTTLPLQLRINRSDSIGWWGGNASYLEGESKSNSRIVKIGNLTDNNGTNATIVARQSNVEMEKGTGIILNNLSIENYDDTEFNQTSGYALYSNISRSTLQNLNVISFKGFDCSMFSSLFENIVFDCIEEALHLTNGTSNLFRFLYAPGCKNPYYIHSQYSTLLSVCCDNAKGDLFTLGGMALSLQSCGCESKNATNIFVVDTGFTTLSIRDFYLHRQVGYADESIAPEDCSILKVNNACPIDIENISIVETEPITGTSYFINAPADSSVTTNIKNIRNYKNYSTGASNDKIKMWKNKPATQAIQRLSTPTMSYNYFVDSNLNLVPFIGGYNSSDNSTVQGYVIDTSETHNKTIWLDTKTKYSAEDGSDTRYSGRHNVGDVQLFNDPLTMNALGLSITHVTNNYTWDTNEIPIVLRGDTSSRPSSNKYVGLQYFDTTLGQPIWWDGSHWVDSTGTQV